LVAAVSDRALHGGVRRRVLRPSAGGGARCADSSIESLRSRPTSRSSPSPSRGRPGAWSG